MPHKKRKKKMKYKNLVSKINIIKFFIVESFDALKLKEIKKLDQSLKNIKLPIFLLERLEREFGDSHNLSL